MVTHATLHCLKIYVNCYVILDQIGLFAFKLLKLNKPGLSALVFPLSKPVQFCFDSRFGALLDRQNDTLNQYIDDAREQTNLRPGQPPLKPTCQTAEDPLSTLQSLGNISNPVDLAKPWEHLKPTCFAAARTSNMSLHTSGHVVAPKNGLFACHHASKADSTLSTSQPVPQVSTARALSCLTSEVKRHPVHSGGYGHRQHWGNQMKLDKPGYLHQIGVETGAVQLYSRFGGFSMLLVVGTLQYPSLD